jgi:uncharacterized protein YndB with AHSA1/START domain
MPDNKNHDDTLDLVLTRTIDVPREIVWKLWTEPEHMKKWFAPKPWTTVDIKIDLRPGGIISSVMRSPEGKDYPNVGCVLEVVKNEKLVWSDALLPGFRPAENPFFTAVITLEDDQGGTKYTARAMHKDPAGRKKHEDMGFFGGWSQCLDQLVEVANQLKK